MADYKKIPADSIVRPFLPVNYYDVIEYSFPAEYEITADDIQIAFWSDMPKWVNRLFKLRNWLVKPFGLKSGTSKMEKLKECITTGSDYDMMSVPAKSDKETVIALNDKHLKAYISIYMDKGDEKRTIAKSITLVKFHSWLGYMYFYAIMPFHWLVVKQMLKYTVDKLVKRERG